MGVVVNASVGKWGRSEGVGEEECMKLHPL